MDCNKEEAIRAKEIAEKKIQNKDYSGARKIALKAQQLYPDLENISQMIVVCDVHCSAENKVYGNEKDWYGILQVEPTADEASIKKQFKKYALLLHPDKNKCSGAADAFKLIREAHSVLLDRDKRMIHDSKRRATKPVVPNWVSQQASSNSNIRKQPWVQNHYMSKGAPSFSYQQQRQAQPAFPSDKQTFWTVCPFCLVRYQYHRDVVNRLLHCQSCKRTFTGCEIKDQAAPLGTNLKRSAFPQQKEVPSQGAFRANTVHSIPKMGSEGNFSSQTGTSAFGRESKANEKFANVDVKISKEAGAVGSKSSRKVNGKRRKGVVESSESSDTESSSDSEEDTEIGENGDVLAKDTVKFPGEYPRRSTRSKTNVSYNEHSSDDDDLGNHSKKAKHSGTFNATMDPLSKQEAAKANKPDSHSVHMEENMKKEKHEKSTFCEEGLQNGKGEKENGETRAMEDGHKRSSEANGESSSSPIKATDPEIYEYPDPDFSDFDKDKERGCFAVGQIWAAYDILDAMPRFYARIRKKYSQGFKLQITWLEPDPDPDNEDEVKWADEGLPVSCGKFKHGNSEITEDHPMFSHLVYWEKGSKRDTFKIYPRKGETWALFKNWDLKWHSIPDWKKKYEFEFVEVLSDYAEDIGVTVRNLGKVKGFSCLFCRTTMKEGVDSYQIPPNELLRFSHRVPSFQMSGEERSDVPKGSFELDPASLPANLEEIVVPNDPKEEAAKMNSDTVCSKSPKNKIKPVKMSEGNTSGCQMNKQTELDSDHISPGNCTEDPDAALPSTPEEYEIPESEFYNFDGDKSPEKFQIGQVWALYSDEDGLPKYYAQIKKIDNHPEFKVQITWLTACPLKNTVQWLDAEMLISCGMFRLQRGANATEKYNETGPFSHQVRVEFTDNKDAFVILPRKGEVWGLYKNWDSDMTCSDLETCEYDLVEIIEETDWEVRVLVLEPVNGFKSVFKAKTKGGSRLTMDVARRELLRFSHQIPAFRLTGERGGTLRGYLELDPAALPVTFFCTG